MLVLDNSDDFFPVLGTETKKILKLLFYTAEKQVRARLSEN